MTKKERRERKRERGKESVQHRLLENKCNEKNTTNLLFFETRKKIKRKTIRIFSLRK